MTIKIRTRIVYFAPTANRTFMTKAAAINREARAIIKKHFPDEGLGHACTMESCGLCGDMGWTMEYDQPERFKRYMTRLTAALKATIK